ncbi:MULTISPECIES: hypothetical protein [unclassified Massilia]|nr:MULTISPECIES: hypothetical protein [unclassified Massilia]MBD8531849.1 hypothetical protein [Massilia sp. CFBP 13647]MBD8675294.1 hypothetical protein [Massilia sp. CFBP 13721]
MTPQLGLRTLLLLALVAASTLVLVAPELFGARGNATRQALLSMLALGHA